ncbi:MAG: ATP-dependent metallopeptidase FtsH/Yme1/Tma family protein, partial [Spirochaetaceae bacterium]|nr:ATP-dependent metallopeptidase FtsH/Yme1/Tma family protein [Spirochaetaceae bacterium]
MNNPLGHDPKKNKKSSQFPFGGPHSPFPKNWGGWKFSIIYVLVLVVGMSLFNYVFMNQVNPTIDFSDFKAKIASGEIKRVELTDAYFTGYTTLRRNPRLGLSLRGPYSASSEEAYRTVPINDPDIIKLMDEKGVSYFAVSREGSAILNIIFSWVLPIGILFFIWRFFMKRLGNMGGNVLSVGQNKAVIVAEGDIVTRFGDVAGVDEAKDELVEVVDFLKNPKKYTDIGGKIP